MNYTEKTLYQGYASLHNHTHYSNIRMLDCTIKENQLIDKAIELGLKGVAITDHESLSGHVKALQYIKKLKEENPDNKATQDFKLLLGNEIYLCPNKMDKEEYTKSKEGFYHFILIAKDKVGHEQLRELSSRAWSNSYRQYIERVPIFYKDLDEIIGNDKGHIIASTACLGGFVPQQILKIGSNGVNRKNYEGNIARFIAWAKDLFEEDFYLELQPSKTEEQVYVNKELIKIGKRHKVKCIVTTDSHYLTEEDRPVHKAYLNAGDGDREVDAFYSSTYLMTPEEIAKYFEEYIEEEDFSSMLNNTLEIANKCEEYDLYHIPIVPKIDIELDKIHGTLEECSLFFNKNKQYEYITNFINSEYEQDRNLILRVYSGLKEKFNREEIKQYHLDRIEIELKELWNISEKMGERLSAYLITVSKIIEIIWNEGDSLVGPSRGSALGFFINYLLDITQISPLDKEMALPHWRSNIKIGFLPIAI